MVSFPFTNFCFLFGLYFLLFLQLLSHFPQFHSLSSKYSKKKITFSSPLFLTRSGPFTHEGLRTYV